MQRIAARPSQAAALNDIRRDRSGAPGRCASALPGGPKAKAPSGWSAARRRPAGRDGRASWKRLDRCGGGARPDALRPSAMSSPTSSCGLRRSPGPSPAARAGGSHSTRCGGRPADALPPSGRRGAWFAQGARRRLKWRRSPPKGSPNPYLLRLEFRRAGTSWTIASILLSDGSCSPASSRLAARSSQAKCSIERPEKMGYPIPGVVEEGEGGARSREAGGFLSRQRRCRQGRGDVQEMRRLPQCAARRSACARPQPAWRSWAPE